jgi:hypothetical protein
MTQKDVKKLTQTRMLADSWAECEDKSEDYIDK